MGHERSKNFCKPDITVEGSDIPIGANLYLCLKTAISKGLGESSIRDILISPITDSNDDFTPEEKSHSLSVGLRKYQEELSNIAGYSINLFEQDRILKVAEIGEQIKHALTPNYVIDTMLPPKKLEKRLQVIQPKRACMPDYET